MLVRVCCCVGFAGLRVHVWRACARAPLCCKHVGARVVCMCTHAVVLRACVCTCGVHERGPRVFALRACVCTWGGPVHARHWSEREVGVGVGSWRWVVLVVTAAGTTGGDAWGVGGSGGGG